MIRNGISRRDFFKFTGISAAAALYASSFGSILQAQDAVTNIVFGGWGATAEDEGVQAAIQVFQEENPNIAVEWLSGSLHLPLLIICSSF
jgi:multiple sugar transport system substrate-binding protein